MKKIIASNASHFSEGAFAFAKRLNKTERILAVGVFLPQATFADIVEHGRGAGVPLFAPSGSFGRSQVSLIFKKSFVNDVLADHQLPVFIAHR